MKTVIKKVYYCDFCGKRYLSGRWIKRHEERCTKNPNRICGMCSVLNYPQPNLPKLIEKYKNTFIIKIDSLNEDINDSNVVWKDKPVTIKDISDSVEGCPNCILSLLRLVFTPLHIFEFKEKFDYKKAFQDIWNEINSQREYDDNNGYY